MGVRVAVLEKVAIWSCYSLTTTEGFLCALSTLLEGVDIGQLTGGSTLTAAAVTRAPWL